MEMHCWWAAIGFVVMWCVILEIRVINLKKENKDLWEAMKLNLNRQSSRIDKLETETNMASKYYIHRKEAIAELRGWAKTLED